MRSSSERSEDTERIANSEGTEDVKGTTDLPCELLQIATAAVLLFTM